MIQYEDEQGTLGGGTLGTFLQTVRGVGGIRMLTLDTKTDVHRGSGVPSTDGPGG